MTTASRIRLGHAYGEVAPNTWTDFYWVHEHESELLEQYGECIILVYRQTVIGKGQTLAEVVADAEQNLSDETPEATPITYFLRRPPTINPSPTHHLF